MINKYGLVDEHDVGLRLWLDVATEGLNDDAELRVRRETQEHFVAALDELREAGMSEGAARVAAVERLGDPKQAQLKLLESHYPNTHTPGSWVGQDAPKRFLQLRAAPGWRVLWTVVFVLMAAVVWRHADPPIQAMVYIWVVLIGLLWISSEIAARAGQLRLHMFIRAVFWVVVAIVAVTVPGLQVYLVFTPFALWDIYRLWRRYNAYSTASANDDPQRSVS